MATENSSVLDFDALNLLGRFDDIAALREYLENNQRENCGVLVADKNEVADIVLDILIMSYMYGESFANTLFGTDFSASEEEVNITVDRKVDGKDYRDRVLEYVEANDIEGIMNVADTESHHAFSKAEDNTARQAGKKSKMWVTMGDDRVRDPHRLLDGKLIGIDEAFEIDGASAMYPGSFGRADLDCNCRCYLLYK